MLAAYRALPRVIHLLVIGAFVNKAGSCVLPFLSLYLSQKLELGPRIATLGLGVYGLGSLVGSFVGGQLADRVGRRKVMAAALLGAAAMLLTLSRARSVPALLSAIFFLSCASDMYRPAVQAFIVDVVPTAQRVHAFGLIYIAINLGFAIAPVAGGMLAERSFSDLFYLDAATSALFGAFILLVLPESRPSVARAPREPGSGSVAPALRHMLGNRVFLGFLAGLFLVTLGFTQAFSTLPLSMAEVGIGQAAYGRIIAVNGLLIVVMQVFVTSVVARMDRGVALALSAFLVGAGFGLTGLAVGSATLVGSVVIWTLGEMIQAPLTAPVVADLAPPELRGRYLGFMGLTFSLAASVSAPLGGYLLASLGRQRFWLVVALAAAVAALIQLALRSHLRARVPSEH